MKINTEIPLWALEELQEDLQDAAVDMALNRWSSLAEARYQLASEKLHRAIALVVGQ